MRYSPLPFCRSLFLAYLSCSNSIKEWMLRWSVFSASDCLGAKKKAVSFGGLIEIRKTGFLVFAYERIGSIRIISDSYLAFLVLLLITIRLCDNTGNLYIAGQSFAQRPGKKCYRTVENFFLIILPIKTGLNFCTTNFRGWKLSAMDHTAPQLRTYTSTRIRNAWRYE